MRRTRYFVIESLLEYAVPVWHHLLTKTETDIESVQKRALRIIYSFSNDIPHCNSLDVAGIASLSTRRNELSYFFIPQLTFLLSPLFPPPRDPDLLARLRAPPNSPAHTHKLKNSRSYHTPFPVIKHRFYLHQDLYYSAVYNYTPSSTVTLISIAHDIVYVVQSFYFSRFQLLLSVHVSI